MEQAIAEHPEWLERAGENVRQLYRYWLAKCRGGCLPSRADIDPTDIPRLLPYLTLVEVVADHRRYVYRLVGTKEVEVRGQDPTGKSVAEAFYGPSAEEAHMFYDLAVATGRPVYDDSPFIGADGRYNDDEMLFLPLSDDGERVTRILLISQCSPTPDYA
ncbi:PAS domain-containing protein [Dongia sp.]|uniref:PAS domain-containing protein n=1 Tax=Dongia sp. TaxID=1977262 RepID=UPI0035B2D75F